jgi:hypothetical protein
VGFEEEQKMKLISNKNGSKFYRPKEHHYDNCLGHGISEQCIELHFVIDDRFYTLQFTHEEFLQYFEKIKDIAESDSMAQYLLDSGLANRG